MADSTTLNLRPTPAVAAILADRYGITTTVHHRPYGSVVDPCTWCDLHDPEAAVVTFTSDLPDACLGCADTAAQTVIEHEGGPEGIRADVYAIESPSISSEPDGPAFVREPVTVHGTELEVHAASLDLATEAGRDAAIELRDAVDAALKAA